MAKMVTCKVRTPNWAKMVTDNANDNDDDEDDGDDDDDGDEDDDDVDDDRLFIFSIANVFMGRMIPTTTQTLHPKTCAVVRPELLPSSPLSLLSSVSHLFWWHLVFAECGSLIRKSVWPL